MNEQDRVQALASCLVDARREQRVLEAVYDVVGRMLHTPETPVDELVKRYAKYHKVRMDEVRAVLKRLTEANNYKEEPPCPTKS